MSEELLIRGKNTNWKLIQRTYNGCIALNAVWHNEGQFDTEQTLIMLYLGANQYDPGPGLPRTVPSEELEHICNLCTDSIHLRRLIEAGYVEKNAEGYVMTTKIFLEYADLLLKSNYDPLTYNLKRVEDELNALFPE